MFFLSSIPQPRWICRLSNEFNQSKGNRWTVVSFLYIVTRINGFLDSHFSTLEFRYNAGGGVCHGLRTTPIQNHCSIPFPAIGTRGNSCTQSLPQVIYIYRIIILCISCNIRNYYMIRLTFETHSFFQKTLGFENILFKRFSHIVRYNTTFLGKKLYFLLCFKFLLFWT